VSRPTPQPIAKWLTPAGEQIGTLLSRVRLLRRYTAALRGGLPPSLAAQCQAANLDGTNLVIAVSSSAWAAKLRYQLTAVLGHLKTCDDLPPVDALRIRIQPLRLEPATRPVSRAPLSAETATVIRHVADNTTDPALRAALQRLVRHVVKPRP